MTKDKSLATAAKLRDDIDKGKSGDKIGFPDPATAPLGTDAEARGASPTREEVRTARRHEVDRGPAGPAAARAPRPVSAGKTSGSRRRNRTVILVIVALVLISLLILWAIL